MTQEHREYVADLLSDPPPWLKTIAQEKYGELSDKINEYKRDVVSQLNNNFLTSHSPTLRTLVLAHLTDTYPIKELEQQAKRFQRLFATYPTSNHNHLSPQELEHLKHSNPIEELHAFEKIITTSPNRLKALCPFHEEKTPSFTIYTNTNSYFCYGCNAGGDVIAFLMKLHGIEFKEAIKYLV
jgi:hypothetical protein